jgi:hypothetical protein
VIASPDVARFRLLLLVVCLLAVPTAAPAAWAAGPAPPQVLQSRLQAQAPVPAVDPSPAQPSPAAPGTPLPIVPAGDPLGRIGVVAMVVVAIAGFFIYRVIRKGL